MSATKRLRVRSRVGKYRIISRLAEGGFANVYCAYDTIEGMRVALKVPRSDLPASSLELLRKEIKLMARLEHPTILPVKNADEIDGRLIIAYPLGVESLHTRMKRRMGTNTALDVFEQVLDALAYAHGKRVVHCDVKPDNVILFADNVACLADFGLAKVVKRTIEASGSGTLGYMAPEQAMGRPSFRSDVFSLGLVLYRMLTGELPDWPYRWPMRGHHKLRRKVTPQLMSLINRMVDVDERHRYRTAMDVRAAYDGIRRKVRATNARGRRSA